MTKEEAEIYAKKNNLYFLELSAKYGTNVQEAFQRGSEEVLKKIENGEINPMSDVDKIINLKLFFIEFRTTGSKFAGNSKGKPWMAKRET